MSLPDLEILASEQYDSTDDRPGFGTWKTVSSDRAAIVIGEVTMDASDSNSIIDIEIDESGGTSKDYELRMKTPSSLAANRSFYIFLPIGASYRVVNQQDPVGNNAFNHAYEAVL